jgi:hypothetical protein
MDRLLRALVALNAAILVLLIFAGVGAAVVASRLLSEVRDRQRAVETRMAMALKATDEQIREFTNRRSALQPLASGPMGKLDQEIHLMQLMADEQLALIAQFGSILDEIQPAAAARRPAARKRERGKKQGAKSR